MNKFAGPWLLVDLACGETQEERLQYFDLRRGDGESCDSTSTRTIYCQRSSGSRIRNCRCSANNQQSRNSSSQKDTSSPIDVTGLGRPKEFTGREEDFQQRSSGPLNSRRKSRRQRLISSSCRRMLTRTEECKTWSSCCTRCTQHSWLSRVVRRMTLSPTRGRIRWRRGGDCRSDMIRRQEEGNEIFCARSFLLDGALFWNSKRRSNVGSPTCLATRRR